MCFLIQEKGVKVSQKKRWNQCAKILGLIPLALYQLILNKYFILDSAPGTLAVRQKRLLQCWKKLENSERRKPKETQGDHTKLRIASGTRICDKVSMIFSHLLYERVSELSGQQAQRGQAWLIYSICFNRTAQQTSHRVRKAVQNYSTNKLFPFKVAILRCFSVCQLSFLPLVSSDRNLPRFNKLSKNHPHYLHLMRDARYLHNGM